MIIQRLNMDNSWFIEVNGLKLLVDPWLEGEEVDYFRWFNTQWHRTPPINFELVPDFDVVLITQIFPDHFHKKTLQRLNPSKVVAPKSIQKSLQKLLPNADIIGLNKKQPQAILNGIEISMLPGKTAIGPSFKAYTVSSTIESVLLAPHGYNGNYLSSDVGKELKLIVTPFNRYALPFFLGGTLAPGVEGLKKLVMEFNPKFLVCTHDEDKHASGLVSKLARVTRISSVELNNQDIFKGKIIEIADYNPVRI